ncbi:MAG TPA: DUF6580 family putative transport protein [Terriglobia bacterium]|nr:DUF6580 family putative transport protein [Terriglobia bacterium]
MVYLIVLAAVLARFAIVHPTNFSPVYAALLFAGAFLKKRDSLWYPLGIIAVCDFLLTLGIYRTSFHWVYMLNLLAFAAIIPVGWWLRGRTSVGRVFAAALAGPTVFFVVSNLMVWAGGLLYPRTAAGLTACFALAIPFYGNTLASGVLFSAILFGGYEYYRRKVAQPPSLPATLG